MNNWPVPPKRFEKADDPKFDPIRPRRWFARLLKRKWQIDKLDQAYRLLSLHPDMTQETVCGEMMVDSREFRDYCVFTQNAASETIRNHQAAIDYAYDQYVADGAEMPWRSHLEASARVFGLNPRRFVEKWEVEPRFYPTSFLNEKKQ